MRNIFFQLLFMIMVGCSKPEYKPVPDNYLILQKDKVWYYTVTKTIWNNNESVIETYFEKDSIVTIKLNNTDGYIAYFQRYQRASLDDFWQEMSAFSIEKSNFQFVLNDGVESIVILIENVNPGGMEWIGNAFSSSSENNYQYFQGFKFSENINELYRCSDCIKVLRSEQLDCIVENKNDYDVYLKGLGLIYQYQLYQKINDLKSEPACLSTFIDYGYEIERVLINTN